MKLSVLAIVALFLTSPAVEAADCTPEQLAQVLAAQQDPAVLAACDGLAKDPSQPLSLTNLDFCRSPQCVGAIKGVAASLPDCSMNGLPVRAGTATLLGQCGPPPGGPGGVPPPGGPGGMPPPGGPDGLPPPRPDGTPTTPTPGGTPSSNSPTDTTPTIAPVAIVPDAGSNSNETVGSIDEDPATVGPNPAETSITAAGSSEQSGSSDGSIESPAENSDAAGGATITTPVPATSLGSRTVVSGFSSAAVAVLVLVIAFF